MPAGSRPCNGCFEMADERIIAEYLVETPLALEAAAETMAGEQSTGTFTRVPGETDELRERFAARVESIEELDSCPTPSLARCRQPQSRCDVYQRGRVRISFPAGEHGPKPADDHLDRRRQPVRAAATLGPAAAGPRVSRRRWRASFRARQFGVAGTRRLTGVYDRPIIGTIVKPSVGLTPQQTAELVRTLGEAGVDFVKDDELMANPPHSPFDERVKAVMNVVNDAGRRDRPQADVRVQYHRPARPHAASTTTRSSRRAAPA